MLNCRQVSELYSQQLEREFNIREMLALKMHILICSACRNFGKQMRLLRQITRSAGITSEENNPPNNE